MFSFHYHNHFVVTTLLICFLLCPITTISKNTKSNIFDIESLQYNIIDSSSTIKLTLESFDSQTGQTHSKVIPSSKTSSCQLIVFVFYDGKFKLKLNNLQDLNPQFIDIHFQYAGHDFRLPVVQGYTQKDINLDQIQGPKEQITEYITITGVSVGSQLSATESTTFTQTRKVYLIRYSENEWTLVTLPFRAIIMTQILALVLIFLLSHNVRYRRFTPFDFGFVFTLVYSSLLIVVIYIDDIVKLISPSSDIESLDIPKYLIGVVALILITIYAMDLLNIVMEEKIPIFIIAFILSFGLVFVDEFILQDFWYINDFVAVFVSGCIIKFVVIRKMKTSIIPLGILWAFSITRQFVPIQSVAQEISLSIFPLHLQIPACFGDDPDGYSCSAFGTSKIIIMGLIVNYSIRIDLFISSRFYEILSISAALFSLFIQLGINLIFDQIPIMQYFSIAIFLPISIGLMLGFAEKRGQWAAVWHGSFYDMAVNRTSIRKSYKESVSLISEKFGDGLMFSGTYSCEEASQSEKQKLSESLVIV